MKPRELLIGTAMMFLAVVPSEAATPSVPSPLIAEDSVLSAAYYDTVSILSKPNECSDFFGGPSTSVEIFNGLIERIRKEYFPPSIGIRMSGPQTNVSNVMTNSRFRLFDKVSINTNGPFYRPRYVDGKVPGVGTFQANTKEGRVLMFLHELGHLVKSQSGDWLLPDDGRSNELSRNNTRKIEDVCGSQIRTLGKGDTVMNAVSGKQVNEKRSMAGTTP